MIFFKGYFTYVYTVIEKAPHTSKTRTLTQDHGEVRDA